METIIEKIDKALFTLNNEISMQELIAIESGDHYENGVTDGLKRALIILKAHLKYND